MPMSLHTAIRGIAAVHPTVKGIALMVMGTAFFAAMHGSVRYVSAEVHPFEIAFFRNVFGFLFFVPWIMRAGLVVLRTRRLGFHAARGAVNGVSMLCWFTGLSLLPLADATALSLATPLFVTVGAILVFRENVRFQRWLGLAAGAVGMLVIVRPGFAEIGLGVTVVLVSTLSVAVSKLLTKSLVRTDGTATIVAWLSLLMTPITLIPALFVWQWPTPEQFLWLIAIGSLGSCGHLCAVKAYKFADVSAVEPAAFVRLIWAAILGYIVFTEVPGLWIWVGGGMIVAATSYLAHRESAAGKEPKRRRDARNRGEDRQQGSNRDKEPSCPTISSTSR